MKEETPLTSVEFLKQVDKHELDAINNLLADIGVSVSTAYGELRPLDLSRKEVDQSERAEISDALIKKSATAIAAALREVREANRARRDIVIANASHKRLMLGVYNTMYQRKLKLENKIKAVNNG